VSFDPWSRSADLARLIAEGYELEMTGDAHLLVRNVPYLDEGRAVQRGIIISKLQLNGDVTVNPVDDHVAYFVGSAPHRWNGERLTPLAEANLTTADGLTAKWLMSLKCPTAEKYPDYYSKIRYHVENIETEANRVDHDATARTFGPPIIHSEDWPFEYADSASGRAGIGSINGRLSGQRIAIVGLGGTGSYILDLIAKCPVAEVHLYDGDRSSSHTAFRAPGAASLEEVRSCPLKVDRYAEVYSRMKRKVIPHPYHIDGTNVSELSNATFVFLAMEGGATKLAIVEELERMGKPFVNASLGVKKPGAGNALQAIVEINGSTVDCRQRFREDVDFGDIDADDPYMENIQVADLNALNASMAVMWWKTWSGVYLTAKSPMSVLFNTLFSRMYLDNT
jgi:hypothetical protein